MYRKYQRTLRMLNAILQVIAAVVFTFKTVLGKSYFWKKPKRLFRTLIYIKDYTRILIRI